jgi:hypothetical protein
MTPDLPTSWSQAKKLGARYYFTGRPCPHGHICKRWSHNSTCYQCVAIASAAFRKSQPDKSRDTTRAWRQRNPEKSRESTRRSAAKWRATHPDDACAQKREHYLRTRDAKIAYQRGYRAANVEKTLLAGRARYAANPLPARAQAKKWQRENPDRKAEIDARRRASQFQAAPSWLTADHKREMAKLYALARRSSRETGVAHHVDHIYPLQGKTSCGLHVPWNLQVLEGAENIRKRNKEPSITMQGAEWRA